MTPRTLFNIILKVLGIFFIRDFLAMVPELLSFIDLFKSPEAPDVLWTFVSAVFTFSVYWIVSYYLIFRSELIIDKFKLDKGFNQTTIPVNTHQSTILSISIMVIGGVMVINGIPDLCRQFYLYLLDKKVNYSQTNRDISFFALSASKIIIGLLLINYQKKIVNYLESRKKR